MPKSILPHVSARKIGLILAAVVSAGIAAYILWYSSAGNFPGFPSIRNEYVDLGQSFLHGQLALLEQPDPRLMALPNPYDYQERQNVPYHWDASYFQGKYYLYWGPAPAVVAAVVQLLAGAPLPGPLLVAIAYLGLLAVFLGILIRISSYFSGRAANLSLGLFMLIGFMGLPLLYVVGSSHVYEAAILYGQFFLLAGLLGWLNYATSSSHRRSHWLFMAGLGWGLAIASRYNLGLSVAIYLAFAFLWLWREGGWPTVVKGFIPLISPLALCMVALALYNQARFGSPLETGFSYALSVADLGKANFSATYIPSNLFVYLRYPLAVTTRFPFLEPAHFHPNIVPEWIPIPKARNFGKMVLGILPSAPVLWLSVLAILPAISAIRSVPKTRVVTAGPPGRDFQFAMIALAAILQFAFLTVYFDSAERFIVDIYPSLVLILAISIWSVDEKLGSMSALRLLLWLSTIGLAAWTVGLGFFACFGLDTAVTRQFDPAVVARLAAFWNPLFGSLQRLLVR